MTTDDTQKLIEVIKAQLELLEEKSIQQRSAHHSDLLRQMLLIEKKIDTRLDAVNARIESIENELTSWKLGSKIGLAVVLALGALITWVMNTLGVSIEIRQ